MSNDFFEAMKGKTDEEYFELLYRAEHEPVIDGIEMPAFPEPEFQKQAVGSSGREALMGGRAFYGLVKRYAEKLEKPIGQNTRILDFGCGWGRMVRFYFKDIKSENIFGLDVDPKMVDICKKTLPCGNYYVCSPRPPSMFDCDTFDIIFAYSVFSHLRSDVALSWIQEFSRILAPDGILVATTQGENFLDYCQKFRDNPDLVTLSWHKGLMRCFDPIEESRTRYRAGEFLYAPTGGGEARDSSFYGEAVIPEQFIKNEFGKHLEFVDYFHDINRAFQAVFAMRKA